MQLSIIIPAYNEEKRIERTVNLYCSFFNKSLKSFELILVPNNCKDKTYSICKKLTKKYQNIKVKNIPYFVGKGGAVLEGFKIAKGDYIGFVDADASTLPEYFFDLYKNIDGFDGIIASRAIKGAKMPKKQPLLRRIMGFVFRNYVRLLFGFNYRDTQCGAKLFKKKVIKYMIKENYIKKWAFDLDLLYTCKRHNFKVLEYPTVWEDNADSKVNVLSSPIEMATDALRLRLHHFKN